MSLSYCEHISKRIPVLIFNFSDTHDNKDNIKIGDKNDEWYRKRFGKTIRKEQ